MRPSYKNVGGKTEKLEDHIESREMQAFVLKGLAFNKAFHAILDDTNKMRIIAVVEALAKGDSWEKAINGVVDIKGTIPIRKLL